MSRVRGVGNRSTELRLRDLLREQKITGWRRHFAVTGKPDFAFPRARLAVFVDGCFWHGCPKCYRLPRSNRRFWRAKFEYNTSRDRLVNAALRRAGWAVVRIWEHELDRPARALARLRRRLDARKPETPSMPQRKRH